MTVHAARGDRPRRVPAAPGVGVRGAAGHRRDGSADAAGRPDVAVGRARSGTGGVRPAHRRRDRRAHPNAASAPATRPGPGGTRGRGVAPASRGPARRRPSSIDADTVMVFLGAVWINDALMLAARDAHARAPAASTCCTTSRRSSRRGTRPRSTGSSTATSRSSRRRRPPCRRSPPRPAVTTRRTAPQRGWMPRRGGSPACRAGSAPASSTPPSRPGPGRTRCSSARSRPARTTNSRCEAWRRLIERHGEDTVPDLVCVGRLGWHADAFLRRVRELPRAGRQGERAVDERVGRRARALLRARRVHGLSVALRGLGTAGLREPRLRQGGRSSRDNSSLPEAGGDLAVYFASGDVDDFVQAVESSGTRRRCPPARVEERIAADATPPITWQQVADIMMTDVARAPPAEGRKPCIPRSSWAASTCWPSASLPGHRIRRPVHGVPAATRA